MIPATPPLLLTQENKIVEIPDEIAALEREPSTEIPCAQPKKKPTKTSDIIRNEIIAGKSRLDCLKTFPHMHKTIKDLCELHEVKHQYTDCCYIFGGTGAGKTTTAKRVLNYFQDNYGITYYSKMGGLSKFFDGYDWQDVILIDDPVSPDCSKNQEQIQMFKTIINEHERIVEIKGGSMPLDSGLIIITANITPRQISNACGPECSEPIYRRITKTPGAFHVTRQSRDKLTRVLISIMLQRFELAGDIDVIYSNLEPVMERQYDLHEWFGARSASPPPVLRQNYMEECLPFDESI